MSTRSFSVGRPTLQTAVLRYECFPDYTRESKVLLAGNGAARVVDVGMLMALTTVTAVTVAADAGNVGNGVFTLAAPAVAAGVIPGNYHVVMLEAVADGGRFEVFGPDGVVVGHGAVGAAFNGTIKFTIADGATDFKANDGWTVTVPVDGTKLVEWDPTALDGSAVVDSVCIHKAIADDGVDSTVLVLARGPAVIVTDGIDWPDGATDNQKAAALASLATKGIVSRAS